MRTYYLLDHQNGDYKRASGTRCYLHFAESGNVFFPPTFTDYGDFNTRLEAEQGLNVTAILPDYFVSRRSFIDALLSLIPMEQRQEIASSWETIAAGLKMPEYVDTHDAELIAFLAKIGLTVDAVISAIQ